MRASPHLSHRLPTRMSPGFGRTLVAAATLAALAALSPAQAANYVWSTGTFVSGATAPNPLPAGDVLDVVTGGTKYLNSALTNNGTINALDDIYFLNGNVLSSTSLFDFKADVGLYDGGWNGGFNNTGVFRKSGSAGGSSVVSINGFTNTGTIDTQVGTLVFNAGASFGSGSQFTGAGATVVSNGATFTGAITSANLSLSGGTFSGVGAQINGSVNWTLGSMVGGWSVAAGQTLAVQAGGTKYMDGSLSNDGTLAASDHLYFRNGNTLSNQALYEFQGDVGFYDGGWNGYFVNTGTLRKSTGAGTSFVSIGGFSSSGTVDVQVGTVNFNAGAVFNDGSHFMGAGQVAVTGGARFNGGYTTADNLLLAGGVYTGNAARINGNTNWTAGRLDGSWELSAGKTLAVNTGSVKYINGSVTNKGVFAAYDDVYFLNANTLVNEGLYDFKGDTGIYNGGWDGNFANSGTLRKTSGTGTSFVSIGGFSNSGTIDAQTGTINFNTGAVFNDGTHFMGAGQVVVSSGAGFNGGYTTAGNLVLAAGVFTGNAARINGFTTWTGGRFDGTWELSAGQTLALNGGSAKYINGTVTNKGLFAASDDLYFLSANTLNNQGTYELRGDVGLYDGGWGGNLVNSGTLRKTAGSTLASVIGIGVSNTGTIDAQTGTINFVANPLFNAGTQTTGAGQVVVSSGARFVGAFGSNGNLSLAAGVFTGGDGSAGSAGKLANGSASFSGGRLDGNWVIGAGTQLKLAPGAGKHINGTVTNQGTMAATDDLFFTNGNTLSNQGVYEIQGDFGLHDGGWGGNFVNSGTLRKTAGTGTSVVASIGFANTGVVDVRTGTIQLPSNFTNNGTLMGVGSFSTNLLTNAGHVAPGASPGTLTFAGNFAQTGAGYFDVELGGTTGADLLLVNGNAALGGTLALACYGACNYAVGEQIVILDSVGTLSGSFAAVTLSGFATGAFDTVYDLAGSRVLLQVTQAVTGVPEPGTWAMLLAGLVAVGSLARRRQA